MEWGKNFVPLICPPGDSNEASLMAGVWEPQIFITGLAEAERIDRFAGGEYLERREEGQGQHYEECAWEKRKGSQQRRREKDPLEEQ